MAAQVDEIAEDYQNREVVEDSLLDRVRKLTPEQRENILRLATPRMVEKYFTHIPHPKQQVFLNITAREAMYGGAAGGGKSDALLMAASQYVDVPGYSALILRRSWPDLNSPGAILDRARNWWSGLDVNIREGGRQMIFPSGARIQFSTLLFERDKYKYQSAEYQFVGFDELTQFSESAYTYLFSRIRRPELTCLNCRTPVRKYASGWKHTRSKSNRCREIFPDPKVIAQYPPSADGLTVFDVPLRMRSASNPGGFGHEWVKKRFVDPKTKEPTAYFVPARLLDNPSLDQETYRQNLEHLSPADRERLLNGDWDVSEEGEMFERHWFIPIEPERVPSRARRVRFWDRAATEGGGDYTVGVKLAEHEGKWYIEDVIRGQWSSYNTQKVIENTAALDGVRIPVRMEQEPGSSGKDVIDFYRRHVLVGYDFDGIPSSGSKSERAAPLASAAEAENVFIVKAQWNVAYLDEMALFPIGQHDDQVDATSGGMNFISQHRRSRLLV